MRLIIEVENEGRYVVEKKKKEREGGGDKQSNNLIDLCQK